MSTRSEPPTTWPGGESATGAPSTGQPLVLGLVHTVPALAATFDDLVHEVDPSARTMHVADAWMLRTAIESGVDAAVHERLERHAAHLAASGADAVLVTCSSIGETAAGAADLAGVPVLRVDAAMASDAVARASVSGAVGRIVVLATLASTVGPTGRLIRQAVEAAGVEVEVETVVVGGAAAAKDEGDLAAHDAAVAEAVVAAAAGADVVVLAQASMASALAGVTTGVPVLTSPRGGVTELLAAARRARQGSPTR